MAYCDARTDRRLMICLALLLSLLAVAAYTDIRWRKIYNWNVYPGIVLALGGNAIHSLRGLPAESWNSTWGLVGFADSAAGFGACGIIMLACFVFFRIGGGDVKAVAMMGAFLGLERGIQAMLWTFILGGALGLIVLIWRVGAWTIVVRSARQLLWVTRLGKYSPLSEAERKVLAMKLFLAPMAIPAVLLVTEIGDRLWM